MRRPSTASKYSSNLARSRPTSVSPNWLDYGLQVRTSMATKCISKLAQSWPPSASLSSLNLTIQVHIQTRSITASKCISEFTRSTSPRASLSSLDLSLQVHIQTRSITASKCVSEFTRSTSPSASQTCSIDYIFNERWWLYGDTGVLEVDRVRGSIYSADPGVDIHHLISISSSHTMKIRTLSFPTFGLTCSVRDFVDPHNCVDPHGQVVFYLLTFLRSSRLMLKEREERFSQRHPLQYHCKRVPNEPIPTYGHSWPQRQRVSLK